MTKHPPIGSLMAALPAYETFSIDDLAGAPSLDWPYLAARALLGQPVDAAISAILGAVGSQAKADRAWMFEYDAELLRFHNSHEWSQRGVASFVEDLQGAPVTMIGWLHQFLLAGKAVMINRVEALPKMARALQVEMLRQSDKSVLSVPVMQDGRLRACIGFDAVRTVRRWSDAEINALFQCAELIAAARYRGETRGPVSGPSARQLAPLVYLRHQSGVRGVEAGFVVSLRSAKNYTEVWLADGSMVLDLRPLGLWSALLPQASFVKVHRTAIVNLAHIQAIDRQHADKWELRLRHVPRALPVSRSCRQELRTRVGI
jgi:head-tail adaptor